MSDGSIIVYGRALSPFTRRVLVWARLQGVSVEHKPIQVVGEEFHQLKEMHGVGRVPLVALPSGEQMIDSWAICDWLESTAPADKLMLPLDPVARRQTTQALALGHALVEKAVAYLYETQRRPQRTRWSEWAARLEDQARAALELLEARCPAGEFFGGAAPNGADIAAVVGHDFLATTHPALLEGRAPKLAALASRADALPAFAETHPKRA